jgi:hypothetical protein
MKPHCGIALSIGLFAAAPWILSAAGDQPYETPPSLKAADFLDASVLKGPHHHVEENVVSDGIFNTYTITSDYGTFRVEGTSAAELCAREVGAITRLKEIDKIAVTAGAIGASVVDMGKGVVHVVTHPIGTVTGVGDGVVRLFGRIGRGANRTVEKLGSDQEATTHPYNLREPIPGGEPASKKSTAGKAVEATGDLTREIIGVNFAMRSWARRLDVDPYTKNPVLHNELRDVAQYDAGGRFAPKLAPAGAVGVALGATVTADDLIWMKEPDEVVTSNEKKLTAMAVTAADSRAFRLNKRYSLTQQVRLLNALDALSGVGGRPEFVGRAAGAQGDADSQYYVESAVLADLFHRTQAPLTYILDDLPGACVLAGSDRFACLFPLDYVVWTEGFAGHFERITKRAEKDFPTRNRELWLTGSASPRTLTELRDRGWTVHEKGLSLMSDRPRSSLP